MENVIALGQQTQRLVLLKLVQTDGALQRPLSDLVVLHLRVRESGEGFYDGAVEPTRRRGSASPHREGPADAPGGAGGVRAVADVDGEEAHEEEGSYEDNNDDRHRRAEPWVA